jgi:hypothetical protein
LRTSLEDLLSNYINSRLILRSLVDRVEKFHNNMIQDNVVVSHSISRDLRLIPLIEDGAETIADRKF